MDAQATATRDPEPDKATRPVEGEAANANAAAPTAPAAAPPPANPAADKDKDKDKKDEPPKELTAEEKKAAVATLRKELDAVAYTNDKTIMNVIRGKSPEQIAQIRDAYNAQYPGANFDGEMQKNMNKDEHEAYLALKDGDKSDAYTYELLRCFDDKERMNQVLESINGLGKDEREKVLAAVKEKYKGEMKIDLTELAKANSGISIGRNYDKEQSLALIEGNKAKAEAVKIDEQLNGGVLRTLGVNRDGVGVAKALEGKDKKERKKIDEEYKKLNGGQPALKTEIDNKLEGGEKKAAAAAAAPDSAERDAQIAAGKLRAAHESTLTDRKGIMNLLEVKAPPPSSDLLKKTDDDGKPLSEDQIKKNEALYKAQENKHKVETEKQKAMVKAYGGEDKVQAMLEKEMSGLDKEKALELLKNGRMSEELALKYAMEGGTFVDREGLKKALKNPDGSEKSKEQLDELQKKYETKYGGGSFNKDLNENIGERGKHSIEVNHLLAGRTNDPDERMRRARELYQHERGEGSSAVGRGVTRMFSRSGNDVDANMMRAEMAYNALKAKQLSGTATDKDKAELDRMLGYNKADTQAYQDAKAAAVNTVATGAGVLAGAAVTFATGGAAAPLIPAMLGAMVGGGATIATKGMALGSDYTSRDVGADLAATGVAVGTAGLAKLPGVMRGLNKMAGIKDAGKLPYHLQSGNIGQEALKGAAVGVGTGIPTGVAQAAFDDKNYGQGGVRTALNILGNGAKTGAIQGIGNGVTGALTFGLPTVLGTGKTVAGAMGHGALGGAIGGGVNSAVEIAFDPHLKFEEKLQKLGLGVLTGTAQGAADAGMMKRHEKATEAKQAQAAPAEVAPVPQTQEQKAAALRELAGELTPAAKGRPGEEAVAPRRTEAESTFKISAEDRADPARMAAKAEGAAARAESAEQVSAAMAMNRLAGRPEAEGIRPLAHEVAQAVRRQAIDETRANPTQAKEQRAAAKDFRQARDGENAALANKPGELITTEKAKAMREREVNAGVNVEKLSDVEMLLARGFKSQEVVDHYSPHKWDADSSLPRAGHEKEYDARVAGKAHLNHDGSERAPLSQNETVLKNTVDINATLNERVKAGQEIVKQIPAATVGDLQTGKSVGEKDGKPVVRDALGWFGDHAEAASHTDRKTGATLPDEKLRTKAGLGYGTDSPYVDIVNGKMVWKPEVVQNGVFRQRGKLTDDMLQNSTVPLGYDVHTAAVAKAQRLHELNAARDAAGQPLLEIPSLLQMNPSAAEAKRFPQMSMRVRSSQTNAMTGMGYSAEHMSGREVVPNQERTFRRDPANAFGQDVVVEHVDGSGKVTRVLEMGQGSMVPAANGQASPAADYAAGQKPKSAERLAEAQRILDEQAAQRAAGARP